MEWRQPGGHISFPLLCVASPMETRHHHSGATFSAGDISTNKFVCATERPFREDLRVSIREDLRGKVRPTGHFQRGARALHQVPSNSSFETSLRSVSTNANPAFRRFPSRVSYSGPAHTQACLPVSRPVGSRRGGPCLYRPPKQAWPRGFPQTYLPRHACFAP